MIRFLSTVRQTKVNIGRLVCDSMPAAWTKVSQPSLIVPVTKPKNTMPSATKGMKSWIETRNSSPQRKPIPSTIRPMEIVIQKGPRIDPR